MNVDTLPQQLVNILPGAGDGNNATGESPATLEAFFQIVNARGPIYPAAATPIKSNLGFQLLAFAIESIAGQPFEAVLKNVILDPLGMKDTTTRAPQLNVSKRADTSVAESA